MTESKAKYIQIDITPTLSDGLSKILGLENRDGGYLKFCLVGLFRALLQTTHDFCPTL